MRLRVRMPNDEEKVSGRHWLLRWWFGEPVDTEAAERTDASTDRRWASICGAKYLQRGRLYVREKTGWRADYLFDVLCNRQVREVRISLGEASVTEWEKLHDRRMTEAQRWKLVVKALEKALQSKSCSCREVVSETAVKSSDV